MSAQVIIRDLWKSYDGLEAVRGVSFAVKQGEIFGLLGPNGAGKTTTLECVLGLRQPDRGEMTVAGIDARSRPREMKQRIGAALQTTALQEKITPREALRLFGSFYRERVDADELLERFGLVERADAAFDTLSGGQKQRLALALAFVNHPSIVFLDEPTTGLDPRSRRELHGDIREMRREGRTVVLSTHYIEEAEALCDRVAFIHHGQVIAEGSPRSLIERSNATPSIRLELSAPISRKIAADLFGDVDDLEISGATARFRSPHVNRTLTRLAERLEARGLTILELHIHKATLEDVFIELTGDRIAEQP